MLSRVPLCESSLLNTDAHGSHPYAGSTQCRDLHAGEGRCVGVPGMRHPHHHDSLGQLPRSCEWRAVVRVSSSRWCLAYDADAAGACGCAIVGRNILPPTVFHPIRPPTPLSSILVIRKCFGGMVAVAWPMTIPACKFTPTTDARTSRPGSVSGLGTAAPSLDHRSPIPV